MPKDFIYETAITIDHDDNVMLVDTTKTAVASQLLRCGFQETTRPDSRPYRRFRGQADKFRFRKPKDQRKKAPTGKKFLPGARIMAQNTPKTGRSNAETN